MKATEYQRLKTGLDKLTEWSDTLRTVYAKVETPIPVDQREPNGPTTRWITTDEAKKHAWFHNRHNLLTANQNWIAEVTGMMDSCLDGFVEENQGRADQGRAVTDDGRALFDAMSRFLDATDTPIEGMAGLYQDVRTRCRDWRDRMITWFPDINTDTGATGNHDSDSNTGMSDHDIMVEQFRTKLLKSSEYLRAKSNKKIAPPFTWNESIRELVMWLIDWDHNYENPLIPTRSRAGTTIYLWSHADGAFLNRDGAPITSENLKTTYANLNRS